MKPLRWLPPEGEAGSEQRKLQRIAFGEVVEVADAQLTTVLDIWRATLDTFRSFLVESGDLRTSFGALL